MLLAIGGEIRKTRSPRGGIPEKWALGGKKPAIEMTFEDAHVHHGAGLWGGDGDLLASGNTHQQQPSPSSLGISYI